MAVFRVLFLAGLLMLSVSDIHAQSSVLPEKASTKNMVLIPDGVYTPLYKSRKDSGDIEVAAFYLDIHPVTNAEFLEFVLANPKWRRSSVKPLFADQGYLKHWAGDVELGPGAEQIKNNPVTNVSWFAARAFAKWKGKRLPTEDEWEYVAAASESNPDGANETGYKNRILQWYSRPTRDQLPDTGAMPANYWGVHDMHGLVWEWVANFNSALVTGESRADSGLERKLFCGSGSIGAADVSDYASFMRYAFRSSLKAQYAVSNLGFRCAKDVVNQ